MLLVAVGVACGCADRGSVEPGAAAPSIEPPPFPAPVHGPGSAAGSFFDHFDGLVESRWILRPESSRIADSEAQLDFAAARGEACSLESRAKIDPDRSQLWVACARYRGDAAVVPLLSLEDRGVRFRVSISNLGPSSGLLAEIETRDGSIERWSEAQGWGAHGERSMTSAVVDVYFTVGLELECSDAARRVRFLCWSRALDGPGFDQGLRLFMVTDWREWERVFPRDAKPRLVIGDSAGSVAHGTLGVEWVRFADGPRVEAWANGKETAQGAYDTRHWWSYDGELFVPDPAAEPALPRGAPGDWDDHYAKDAWVVQDEDGVYYLFHSGKPKGRNYGIGVAFASHSDGPWTKFDGNPILAPREGTDESGLQFPAVVVDPAHPDPERRWQMLYDGYSAEPLQHAIFLATAPRPTGPWTRRGRVLGPGEPGAFDEFGCAGGVPLWWNGQWEVWYPGLRGVGETGIWSIGRAVGRDLGSLERDGFGPRVTQQSGGEARLNGPMRGRFLPLDDTRGFERDAVVLITDDAVKNNYATSRIRRVTAEGIELYHAVGTFDPARPTLIRQADRASLWPRHIARAGDEWWLYVNLFGTFRGAEGGLQTFDENTALLKHSGEDPASFPFAFDWIANPPIARGVRNNHRSSENIALVNVSVRR